MSDSYRRVYGALRSLEQRAVLDALSENTRLPGEHKHWQKVHAYAVELADPGVDPRAWADAHINIANDAWPGMLEPAARYALQFSLTTWHEAHLLDDKLFTDRGAPLGPLASLTMFSTDFSAWEVPDAASGYGYSYGVKAHAPGFCQHSDRISAGGQYGRSDDVLTYAEFLPRLAAHEAYRGQRYGESTVCSKCGGIAMRLLTAEQLAHLQQVRDQPAVIQYEGNVVPIRRP